VTGAVDVQQHYVPTSLLAALRAARPAVAEFLSRGATDLPARVRELDEAGVEAGLLSVPVLESSESREADAALALRCNDELLEAAGGFARRFGVLIALPFPHVEECLAELQRVQGDPLVRGVIAFAVTTRWTLDLPEFEPVYAAIAAARLPVMVHPAMNELSAQPLFAQWALGASIALPVETSVTAARMMLSGLLDRVPDLTLIVPHLGGVLPFLAQRLVDQSGRGEAEHDVLRYLRTNCLLDTCSYHPPALRCAVETVGAERLLVGSDHPYRGGLSRAVEDIEHSDLEPAERDAILSGNARRTGLWPPAARKAA
jgi:predicted TIM-barrel fold metal-dependent hydrolase